MAAEEISSGYQGLQLIHDVSMVVEERQIVALIGPNGSGKTTVMRTLSGLNGCWSGRLWFSGQDITRLPPHLRVAEGLGLVPAGHRLFLGLTVEKNLRMGAFLVKDEAEVESRREDVFHYFPVLAERRRQVVGSMSGGEQQMCAIGMGLMARPQLLMIDELSMGLAPKLVASLTETILEVRDDKGIAMVLVEQDVPTALRIADQVYVLDEGRVVMNGPPQEMVGSAQLKRVLVGE